MNPTPNADRAYARVVNAWCMYDWANSAFATTIMAAMFPPFYRSLVKAAGFGEADATAFWGYTTSIALLSIAILAPVLGAISDHTGGKKRYAAFFASLGIISTGLLAFLGEDTYVLASILFILGNVGFAGANIFYESLLPHIAVKDDIDQISTRGYALGYVGGGILLVINVLWYMKPEWFFIPNAGLALRISFFSVAVWWALFSIPLFRSVPEPPLAQLGQTGVNVVRAGFGRLASTFRHIRQYKQLLLFLVAFWLYNDGIGTIIKMATAYGDEIGISLTDMTAALIITQFVGIPFSFGFGWLARRLGAKRSILLALGVYLLISIAGYFMTTAAHFYVLAFMVGTVQGGSQALSRSLYGAMVPKSQSAEFFGFFSTSSKFAGIAGPLLFGVVSQIAGGSRLSIVSLIVFFTVGGFLLTRVDEREGIRVAKEEDRKWSNQGIT
ncbi:MAG: MFS transporter [Chloroflexi bacterium]|nr:MAG: MFS transporter [Chloroflexota bacterium]